MSLSLSQRHRSESWRRPGQSFLTLLLLPGSWSRHQIPREKPGDAKATRRAPLTPITGQTSPRCPPGCRNCSPASSPPFPRIPAGLSSRQRAPRSAFHSQIPVEPRKTKHPRHCSIGNFPGGPHRARIPLGLGQGQGHRARRGGSPDSPGEILGSCPFPASTRPGRRLLPACIPRIPTSERLRDTELARRSSEGPSWRLPVALPCQAAPSLRERIKSCMSLVRTQNRRRNPIWPALEKAAATSHLARV